MEQYIDIKYINNLINLGLNNLNSIPNIKEYKLNFSSDLNTELNYYNSNQSLIINQTKFDNNKSKEIAKIKQIENIKNKIFILLDNFIIEEFNTINKFTFKNSSIMSYDIKTETSILRNFEDAKPEDFIKIFIIEDDTYCIVGTKIICLDNKNLEKIREWEIGEKLYNFCLFESNQILKMNLDIFYVNFQNELKIFGKCILFDIKQKTLYKEQNLIDKILFHDGLLMWSSNFTMKIFDLKNKQMVLRKSYEEVKESIIKNFVEEFEYFLKDDFVYNKEYLGKKINN